MQIDTSDFDLAEAITLQEAAALLGGRALQPPAPDTLRKWADPKKGCLPQGPQGPRLVLPTVRVGGRLFTMPAWVAHFAAARVDLGRRAPGVVEVK